MLIVNTLIKWADNNQVIERVLWLNNNDDLTFVIDINANNLPFQRKVSDLELYLKNGEIEIENEDPTIRVISEDSLTILNIEKRDKAWEIITSLVANEPYIYISNKRSSMVKEISMKYKISEKTILNYLKRYWIRGKIKNALLPDFYNCGGRGKEKSVGDIKRGRPRKYNNLFGYGVNINEEIKKTFRVSIKKFYNTSSKKSLVLTYELMLKEFFNNGYKFENGLEIPVLKSSNEIPTLTQFRYWFNKERDIRKEISSRISAKKYYQQHRQITGSSTSEALGPGSIYQIDATIADVYLVSRFNRNWIVGRPIIYNIMDVFSRMIVGVYVGFEGPSWAAAMNALANAATSKIEFCKQYDIEISEEEWPVNYLPETILADRGEFEGSNVENIIETLFIKVKNTPPYRAEMKGIIEQHFHTLNTTIKPFLPGTIDSNQRERGDRDYRLDAKLDIYQFTQIIIRCILFHNNHHILKNYSREEMMIQDNINPVPKDLWSWGIKNRSGSLRTVSDEIIKLYLMPKGTALVTAKGIKFKNIYYYSNTSIKERWFETARNSGSWKINVSYDPRNMDNIYFINANEKSFQKCSIFEHQSKYLNKTYEEIEYLIQKERTEIKNNSTKEVQSKVDLISHIEDIVQKAEKQTNESCSRNISKNKKLKGIRDNRLAEKNINRQTEAFMLVEVETDQRDSDVDTCTSKYDESEFGGDLKLLKRKQKEELKKLNE
ncbi:Mu transposase C-terminal domain-containing protein [Candidatus Clostridium radicumherbarum]|uniref:Mu transposase C-terminal domain-containing protein n=1 Tax=Candidatus Clostridium radicumherbarum TaxID=3381662 RepID=A0ABW8TYF5_9CLOT